MASELWLLALHSEMTQQAAIKKNVEGCKEVAVMLAVLLTVSSLLLAPPPSRALGGGGGRGWKLVALSYEETCAITKEWYYSHPATSSEHTLVPVLQPTRRPQGFVGMEKDNTIRMIAHYVVDDAKQANVVDMRAPLSEEDAVGAFFRAVKDIDLLEVKSDKLSFRWRMAWAYYADAFE